MINTFEYFILDPLKLQHYTQFSSSNTHCYKNLKSFSFVKKNQEA